jgi:hypothetical protein
MDSDISTKSSYLLATRLRQPVTETPRSSAMPDPSSSSGDRQFCDDVELGCPTSSIPYNPWRI